MDYPSPQNYLEPLYSTAALPPNGSNTAFYSNPEFDEKLAEANSAEDNESAIALYQEAEDILLQDMPIMPMFFSLGQYVHSEKISNVKVDAFSNIVLEQVTVNE
jgi:ABC-type transport system substrate-binding protein